jgi:type IV pilus assembly protein PilC
MNISFSKIQEFTKVLSRSFTKIKTKEKINFFEQLWNLLNSWIPITNALKIISYQTKGKAIKNVIEKILDNTNKGIGLKESALSMRYMFSDFDIAIIDMGEITGKLWKSIETIQAKEEKNQELKSKILAALVYPIIIISLSIGMIGVFMIYVIPKIEKMYKDAKVNLPEITQVVIGISQFLQAYYLYILLFIMILIFGLKTLKKNPKFRLQYDKYILFVPLFWPLIRKKILTLFATSLWTLLESGIIINKALEVSTQALENSYYQKELLKVNEGISKGQELSELLWINDLAHWKENPLFPIELASIVKIGEQTGKLSELLQKIAHKFEKEMDGTIKNIQVSIEPLVIVGVGIIIWTIILAIMLPFFNMVNVF